MLKQRFQKIRRNIKYARRYLLFLVIKGLIWIVRLLPFSTACHLARAVGYWGFHLNRTERNRALTHLEMAFGDTKSARERRNIAKKVFENMALMMAECFYLPLFSETQLESMIIGGKEAEDKALKIYEKHKKMILLTAHLGNWEFMGAWATKRVPLTVVARRVYYYRLDELMKDFRASVGMKTLYSRDSPRTLFRELQRGSVLGVLPDQNLKRMAGIFVPFFGKLAYTITGPITLALLTKAPLVPAYTVRVGNKHRVFLEDPLPLDPSLSRKEQIEQLTLAWTQILEKYIRQYPDQWCWNHRRWKTRPPEEEGE